MLMAGQHTARTHTVAMAALLASLSMGLTAAPALAQNIPLPTPRPAVGSQPNTTGSIVPRAANSIIRPTIPRAALGARAQATPAPQSPNPVSDPFAAVLGKPGAASALNP